MGATHAKLLPTKNRKKERGENGGKERKGEKERKRRGREEKGEVREGRCDQ